MGIGGLVWKAVVGIGNGVAAVGRAVAACLGRGRNKGRDKGREWVGRARERRERDLARRRGTVALEAI